MTGTLTEDPVTGDAETGMERQTSDRDAAKRVASILSGEAEWELPESKDAAATRPSQEEKIPPPPSPIRVLLDPAERRWKKRGTVCGIWLDVAGSLGKHFLTLFLLMATIIPAVVMDADSCSHWKSFGLLTDLDEWVCSYTSSYLLSFLAIGATVLFILGARDLLHKRFYYRLLGADGVLEYGNQFPLRDPLMALLVWDCLHLIWYACFVVYIMFKMAVYAQHGHSVPVPVLLQAGPTFDFKHRTKFLQSSALALGNLVPTDAPLAMPSTTLAFNPPGVNPDLWHGMYAKAALVISILTPAILLVFFAFSDYHIVKTLVPLSEFVESEDEEESVATFSQLITLKETSLKQLMPEIIKGEELGRKTRATGFESMARGTSSRDLPHGDSHIFPSIVQTYQHQRKRFKGKVLDPVYFLDSLWPAKVIMSDDLEDAEDKVFRMSCKAFRASALFVLFVIWMALVTQIFFKLGELIHIERATAVTNLVVWIGHAALICVVSYRMITCSQSQSSE